MNHAADMNTAADILRSFVVTLQPEQDQDERTYRYEDPKTERIFYVERSMGFVEEHSQSVERFFLYEMCPTFRILKFNEQGYCESSKESFTLGGIELQFGANGFMRIARMAGFNMDTMGFSGSGYCIDSRYFSSLEDCASAIATALYENTRYNSHRELSEQERIKHKREERQAAYAYWSNEQERMAKALQEEHGIFKGCYSMMGSLSDEVKQRLLDYLNEPSQEKWLAIRNYCLIGGKTLWQVWVMGDAKATRMGSLGYPTSDVLVSAIEYAVSEEQTLHHNKLQTLSPSGLKAV